MLLLGAVALSIPAVTLAAGGGGSAGDQQYTDPFGGTSTPSSTTHATATPTTPATTNAPTTSAPASTVAASSTTSAAGTLTSDPGSMPTATTAGNQLPYTGYDIWLAGAFGFAMVGGGLLLRRRTHRS